MFVVLAYLYLPALPLCLIAWIWSKLTRDKTLSKILKNSAFYAFIGVSLAAVGYIISGTMCSGDFLYGYGGCHPVLRPIATGLSFFFFLSIFSGALYAFVVFFLAAVAEIQAFLRYRKDSGSE